MLQDAQGCALGLGFLHAGEPLLALGGTPKAWSRFGKGPLAVRLTHVLAGGAHALATRCLTAVHQAASSSEVLPAWAAVDAGNGREHHEAKTLAKAGHRVPPRQGLGLVVLGGVEEREFAVLKPLIIRGDERQIDLNGLVPGGIGKALGDTRAVGLLGAVLADLG